MSKYHVSTTINREPTEFLCEPQLTLLDVLRDELHLTGSKEGCSSGDCGACSVTVDGRVVCSCLMLAVEAEGRVIETIEGMARGHDLHPLQRKFLEPLVNFDARQYPALRKHLRKKRPVEEMLPKRFVIENDTAQPMVVRDGVVPFCVRIHIFIEDVGLALQQHRTILDVSRQIVRRRQIDLVE